MNEHLLLDLATDLAYEVALSGAETYRVEETVRHVLTAYGHTPEVAALPNYLIVSVLSESGEPITRMRRIGAHGNNFDAVERLNALSRKICAERPSPEKALEMLEQTRTSVQYYSFPMALLGHFLGAAGFGLLFGCGIADAVYAGLCGILIAFINRFTGSMNANPLFSTLAASFLMSLAAYGLNAAGLVRNSDTVIIGGMMILVPGLIFTNALRDMIYGDINSGINKVVQVLLIAGAMALGSAGARNLTTSVFGLPQVTPVIHYGLPMLCLASFLGCVGFSILFNIHGPGMFLCALGGIASYAAYVITVRLGFQPGSGIFVGTMLSALYSEIMARVRKYPTICYLVISIVPLIPGASLYYTMRRAADGAMDKFVSQGLFTAETAGIMAASIILVSSLVKIYYAKKSKAGAVK
ncbi:MAG: threonine/serine exporter family protein [Candidatus Faecousia sp.]|nr:threonine/serine exporter family protein [Candidatus Faecousia sp.]